MTSSSIDPVFREALERFHRLYERVRAEERLREPTAVALATADARGQPCARTVLLKAADDEGFVFYTNSLSRKGRELAVNPRAALLFFWQGPLEQVQVEGRVEPVAPHEADEYWASRARESRIGAWASHQSAPLGSRESLERRFQDYDARFGADVPRPPHWFGYRVVPERIEFWRSAPHRLNHRESYALGPAGWKKTLLQP